MEAKFTIIEGIGSKRQLTNSEQALMVQKETILSSQRELALMGDKVEVQKRLNDERDKQQKRVAEIEARTQAMMKSAGLSDRKYQQKIALEKAETPEQKEALKKYFNEEASLRENWQKGIRKGFSEFQEQAANAYANVANITQSAFDGMSHSLSDFLLTGKANFADFTKSVLEMMVKMMTQMAMLQAMKAAFGGQTGGFGGAVAGILGFSSGGYVGTPSTPMYGMQPVANGVNVNLGGIHIDGQPQQSSPLNVDMRTEEQSLTQKIKSVLVVESRDGGDLHKIIKAVNGRGY
ncbi:MAG: phage tail tape measure protein [Candidatus Phlomobacter fragariae]